MVGPYFRRKRILKLVEENEVLSVAEISERTGISISTARRDVNLMIADKEIIKMRGGALAINNSTSDLPHPQAPVALHDDNGVKAQIAQKAASLVEDNDIIFVDSGTTVGRMAIVRHPLRQPILK